MPIRSRDRGRGATGSIGLQPIPFPGGLVNYWMLDEAAGASRADSIGGATLAETGGTVRSVAGKDGNAVGSDTLLYGAYLSTTDLTLRQVVDGFGPFSVAGWYQHGNTSQTSILGGDYSSNWELWVNGDKLTFSYQFINLQADLTLVNGTWYHFVLAYERTGAHLWLNGVRKTSTTGILSNTMPGFGLLCGYGSLEVKARGLLDEVSVFNRVLDNSDVSVLYSSGNGKFL